MAGCNASIPSNMCLSSLSFSVSRTPIWTSNRIITCGHRKSSTRDVKLTSTSSYQKFVDFALNETKHTTLLSPSPLQERFSSCLAADGITEMRFNSLQAPKIRLLRSMLIDQNETMQVLDLGVFPKIEYDLPIFCANFFTTSAANVIVLDLNPLHDVISSNEYRDKYYRSLLPLGSKYAELLPWGGKLTGESLRFFSPIALWTRFSPDQDKHDILFAAFKDYYKAWLELMKQAEGAIDSSSLLRNCEAQHRYLTWRAEKDPGHHLLKRLVGEDHAKDLLRNFLFSGVDELGSKTFLDYFPEYELEDGTVNKKRSIIGRSFENRPWDSSGEFIG